MSMISARNIASITSGQLVGQSYPIGSPYHDDLVQISHKILSTVNFSNSLRTHPEGKECFFVLSGLAIIMLGDEEITLKKGDYVVILHDVFHKIIEVLEDFEYLSIRYPNTKGSTITIEGG